MLYVEFFTLYLLVPLWLIWELCVEKEHESGNNTLFLQYSHSFCSGKTIFSCFLKQLSALAKLDMF